MSEGASDGEEEEEGLLSGSLARCELGGEAEGEFFGEAVGFVLSEVARIGVRMLFQTARKGMDQSGDLLREGEGRTAVVQLGSLVDLLLLAPVGTEAVDDKHDCESGRGGRCTLDVPNRARGPSLQSCAGVNNHSRDEA